MCLHDLSHTDTDLSFLLPEPRRGQRITLSWTGHRLMLCCAGCIIRAWVQCCSEHGCMAFACLAGQSKLIAVYMLQAVMLYDTALIFFPKKVRLNDFWGVIWNGCHSWCRLPSVSGFHISLVDLNICIRKETRRGECCGKELFAHAQRIELILWLGRFYPFLCLPFPSNFLPVPVCYLCSVILTAYTRCLAELLRKKEKKKVFRFSLQCLSGGFYALS